MQLSAIDIGDANPAAVASALLRTFGSNARLLVDERVADSASYPDIAERWLAIANAIAVLIEASVLIKTALELLDGVEERIATAHLHQAMVHIGLKQRQELSAPPP